MTNAIKPTDTVWRYMSALEFFALMTQRALMFKKLIRMRDSDRAEGMFPTGYNEWCKNSRLNLDDFLSNRWGQCWMRNESENALMWRAYAPRGVAIMTTAGSLAKAINDAKDRPYLIRDVESLEMLYHDEWDDELKRRDETNGEVLHCLLLARIKRKAFAVENEVRFLAEPGSPALASGWKKGETGGEIPVFPDWQALAVNDLDWIEKVVVDESVDPVFAVSWLALSDAIASRVFHRGRPLSGP